MNDEIIVEQSKIRRLLFEKQCEIKLNPNLSQQELKKIQEEIIELKNRFTKNEVEIQKNKLRR